MNERLNELDGRKVCVITGSSAGIGKATAVKMAELGYEVIMLVRDCDKSRRALPEAKKRSGSDNVRLYYVDLASQQSIRDVVDRIKNDLDRIDVLVNNAGVFRRSHQKSPDGFEMTLAVNYLAPFLLTSLLLPLLEATPNSRVVNVTSELYRKGVADLDTQADDGRFNGNRAYANSKLLLVMFTRGLANRLEESGTTVNCVHPGVVATDVFREYPRWFNRLLNRFISKPEDAAAHVIRLASSSALDGVTGKYFSKSEEKPISPNAESQEGLRHVWGRSEVLTGGH